MSWFGWLGRWRSGQLWLSSMWDIRRLRSFGYLCFSSNHLVCNHLLNPLGCLEKLQDKVQNGAFLVLGQLHPLLCIHGEWGGNLIPDIQLFKPAWHTSWSRARPACVWHSTGGSSTSLIPGVLQVTMVVGHVPDVSTQVISSKIKPHHCLTGAWSSLSKSFLNLSFSTSIPASFFNFTLHSFLFRRTFKMCWVLLQLTLLGWVSKRSACQTLTCYRWRRWWSHPFCCRSQAATHSAAHSSHLTPTLSPHNIPRDLYKPLTDICQGCYEGRLHVTCLKQEKRAILV